MKAAVSTTLSELMISFPEPGTENILLMYVVGPVYEAVWVGDGIAALLFDAVARSDFNQVS
jgi:hypothetical protein